MKTFDKLGIIFGFTIGLYFLVSGVEWYNYAVGLFSVIMASLTLWKYTKEKRQPRQKLWNN